MADLASTDVTYTQLSKSVGESGYRTFQFSLAFGNSTLTYPSGGLALTAGKLGCPNQIRSLVIYGQDSSNGNFYKYDITNNKIRMYRGAGFTPAGTNTKPTFTVEASGAIGTNMEVGLSVDTASATFEGGTGITAQRVLTTSSPVGTPTFTGTAVAATALIEFVSATTAPAATTLYVEVVGW